MNQVKLFKYPKEFERKVKLRDSSEVFVRPIKPSDADLWVRFYKSLSLDTKYLRFFVAPPELDQKIIDKFTKIDYVNNFALIAIITENGVNRIVGIVRYCLNPSKFDSADLAIVITDEWQGRGLGTKLLLYIFYIMKKRHIKKIIGDVLLQNKKILQLMRESGLNIISKDSYGERYFELYL